MFKSLIIKYHIQSLNRIKTNSVLTKLNFLFLLSLVLYFGWDRVLYGIKEERSFFLPKMSCDKKEVQQKWYTCLKRGKDAG